MRAMTSAFIGTVLLAGGLLGATATLRGAPPVPNVSVQDLAVAPRPIRGVDVARTAFVGVTPRGPRNLARGIGSLGAYRSLFGSAPEGDAMDRALRLFFANGGRHATVVALAEADLPGNAKARTGLHALGDRPDVGLLCLPGCTRPDVWADAVAWCRSHRVILLPDLPAEIVDAAAAEAWLRADGAVLRDGNVAAHLPAFATGSPAPAMAGLIARFDAERGPWKAPAGTTAVLADTGPLVRELSRTEANRLAVTGLNPILRLTGRGIVSWGGRTLSEKPEWRYLAVRRLALYLEESIQRGTDWVGHHPNDERLWTSVRASVESFLNETWRKGALAGSRPDHAYFVRCDRMTMTARDLEEGRLVLQVGFAPLRPAEFILLTFRRQVVAVRGSKTRIRSPR